MSEQDENGVHTAEGPDNYHFNILKVVRDAKNAFVAKYAGKVPQFFYAPEGVLHLVDEAVRTGTAAQGAVVPDSAVVTHVFGLELRAVVGTCITVSAEPLDEEEDEGTPAANGPPIVIIPSAQESN